MKRGLLLLGVAALAVATSALPGGVAAADPRSVETGRLAKFESSAICTMPAQAQRQMRPGVSHGAEKTGGLR